MQPYDFSPWIWREPTLMTGFIPPGDTTAGTGTPRGADADELAAEGVAGYHVAATDGDIGSVDEASYEVGSAYIVVDTGPWIFGHKVLLPAGTVQRVDHDERKVYVDRTRNQIKNAPEYDKNTYDSPDYRDRVGAYYTDSYRNEPPTA